MSGYCPEILLSRARRAGLDRLVWSREVRGDGELAVLPAGTAPLALIAQYPRELAATLTKINNERGQGPRIRLRLALHHRTLAEGAFGVAGSAPIIISRLLDSDVLRQQLAQRANLDLVLIISAQIFERIRRDRVLHEALTARADPLHLALMFGLSHTAASRYTLIACDLLG